MAHAFKVGDHVRWNSDVGHVTGKVTKVHTKDTEFMGRHRPASQDDPQYEVKSDKTGHLAMHKEGALEKAGR
jgi:small-conductance mechanosensitive channel